MRNSNSSEYLVETGMDAVIATNTTTSRVGLKVCCTRMKQEASPVRQFANKAPMWFVLADTLAGRLPIIAAGGITEGQHAAEKIKAGASLVQVYSGFIYKGPKLIRESVDAIAECAPRR